MAIAETWIARLAALLGAVAIGLPLYRVWLARRVPRGRSSGSGPGLSRWPAVFAMAAAFVAVGALLWTPIPFELSAVGRAVVLVAGAISYFSGVALYLWGFVTLGSMFGMSSSGSATLYRDHRLVVTGPYALVRHPMYLGVILAAIGALLIFRTWAMTLYAPAVFGILFRARREDRLLADQFGSPWAAYRERVPCWLPRIRPRKA